MTMYVYAWFYLALAVILIIFLVRLLWIAWEYTDWLKKALWKESRKNDLLRLALKLYEWRADYCPTCLKEKEDGHSSDCLVGRALQPDSCAVGEKRKTQKVGEV